MTESTTRAKRRTRIFRGMALSIPLLLLLIGEIVCRSAGYGGYPEVFRRLGEHEGFTYYGTDQRGLSTFFFQNLTIPGSMEEQIFTMPKAPGAIRIALLGGSAARGYPQMPTLAASSFLDAMLSDLRPDQEIEVLNTGTTALASFPLMYILDELLAFDLDLVIVYSGNNEFYGAHGVASVHGFGRTTAAMRLFRWSRRTALVQWLTDVATRKRSGEEGPEGRTRVLMERVVADAQIPVGDSRRRRAPRNLENHLAWLVRRCKEEGVPIIVCTLPCNERELVPIGEDVLPQPGTAQRENLDRLLGQAEASGDPSASAAILEEAIDIHGTVARAHFLLAQAYETLGRVADAAAEYERARDLDTMPWRPIAACNAAVRRAAEHGGLLCDLESAFRDASPGGVTGWDMMDDHVHPSLRGQALIASSLVACMEGLPEPLRVTAREREKLPDWTVYAERLGDNMFDRYGTARRMVRLFEAPFYRVHNEHALRRFEATCADLEARMTVVERDAAREWQDPYVHKGGHRPIAGMVGRARMEAGDFAGANELLTIARGAVPRYSIWNLELTWHALLCRREIQGSLQPDDMVLAQEMVETGTTFLAVTGVAAPPVLRYTGLACRLVGRHAEAVEHLGEAVRFVRDSDGFDVVRALAESLVATDQADRARTFLQTPVYDPVLRRQCRDLLAELESSEDMR